MVGRRKVQKKTSKKSLHVALVCDWLTTPGGAEKVLLELHKMYPDAPIYTSQYSRKGIDWFSDADVRTGWMQIFPAKLRKILGPLRQIYFSHLDLSYYDLVISVTGAEAKAVQTKRIATNRIINTASNDTVSDLTMNKIERVEQSAKHICYCHVPTQYYWQMYDKYVENPGFGMLDPVVRLAFKLLVKPLRKADYKAAQQPDQFVTISQYAQREIKKYYDREAIIIAPPVEITKFSTVCAQVLHNEVQDLHNLSTTYPQNKAKSSTKTQSFSTKNLKNSTENMDFSTVFPQYHYKANRPGQRPQIICQDPPQYYIIACRQASWKRVDLAIQACIEVGVPLLVVGDGPERANLLHLAGESRSIKFLPWAQSDELAAYLQVAKAYIFPSLEPFGMAAVEALAAGCPVIAYKEGGSRDFIIDGENGVLFDKQSVKSLVRAIKKFEGLNFDRAKVAKTAAPYNVDRFDAEITEVVNSVIK